MNALVIAPRREMLCRCACVRVRMRAGEVLGMSAGEERSALAGGGWANLASFFFVFVVVVVVVVLIRASSGVKLFGI